MDLETNDLVARLYMTAKNLSEVDTREVAGWAAWQLQKGRGTEKIRKLVTLGNSNDLSAVEELFRECVADLGWEYPGKKAALKRHAESIMQKMVDGQMEPYDGCSHLYIISIFLKHPDYLYNWNGLFWGREDFAEEELNGLILAEAKRGLAGEVIINESLPHHDGDDEDSPGFLNRLRALVRRR